MRESIEHFKRNSLKKAETNEKTCLPDTSGERFIWHLSRLPQRGRVWNLLAEKNPLKLWNGHMINSFSGNVRKQTGVKLGLQENYREVTIR